MKKMEEKKAFSRESFLAEFEVARSKIERQDQQIQILSRENLRLKSQLAVDEVTGLLWTRNEGRKRILLTMGNIRSSGHRMGMGRMDIDNLRKLNDRFGHESVNGMLAQFGEQLNDWAENKGGVAMRFHQIGDEAGVVIPVKNKEELRRIAGELAGFLVKVESERAPEIAKVKMTFSMGIAHEDEPEVSRLANEMTFKTGPLATAGDFFTALSIVSDLREGEEKRKAKNG